MISCLRPLAFACLLLTGAPAFAQYAVHFPRFRVLAFYRFDVEPDHIAFAKDAIHFFDELTEGKGFVFDTTNRLNDCNDTLLARYDLVMMLNCFPETREQREAFEKYMEHGGGWMGFHVAAYNDRLTNWPWFLQFLGGGVFYRNSWPPLPAKLIIDDPKHPVNKGLPGTYISPQNEWYQWQPSPRKNPSVKVLVSLSPENYPLGLKDILPDGDCPVVWTNTRYRMLYLNMGHGAHVLSDATQNMLVINGFRWVVSQDGKGDPFARP